MIEGFLFTIVAFGFIVLTVYLKHLDVMFRGWTHRSRFSHQHHQVLARYFLFYKQLPLFKKQDFERRVAKFIDSNQFIGRGGLEITPDVETLIAASAVQLTFGLSDLVFEHFDKIIVYPEKFYSNTNQQFHLGEVNPRMGAIVLSWKAFLEGYLDPNDSYNLGLHEMAHALRLENRIPNGEFGFLKASVLREIDEQYESSAEDIQLNPNSFLRAYAGVNQEEFFSVAVENFFERPQEMREAMPALYNSMSRLLNQDPAHR